MKYYSLHKNAPDVSFKEAVINGIAPDKGLYFPKELPILSKDFFNNIQNLSKEEIAFEAIKQFIGDEIPEEKLIEIVKETVNFDFPVVLIENNIGTLELFHGPTMAFKDVGARFMARCLGYFNDDNTNKITVLVATSGDTGGAVANGFLGVKGVDVVILYPSNRVSDIQEKQLTTLGNNITALEVAGSFDDCQDMVKSAFLDTEINGILTSANSINVARWLPQMFYYFFAYQEVSKNYAEINVAVPSGNFGNICAGLLAKKLGLPIKHFIAATNSNDTVTYYMQHQKYISKPSKATISNAMDVGNPSNFIRIQELFNNDFKNLQDTFSSYAFTDEETKTGMHKLYNDYKYIADPHGAVGYLGLKKYPLSQNEYGIFLETAHPAKFIDTVEETLNLKVSIPKQLKDVMHKEKQSIYIKTYEELKEFLNS